jgi:hypothetical protein
MMDTQAKAAAPPGRARKILLRILSVLFIAFIVGCITGALARVSNSPDSGPAGFRLGILHGALMPGALPNLLVGRDVTIYAPNNTGRTYKLGYTVGVNGCGAIFFGAFFWRLNRWRKLARKKA